MSLRVYHCRTPILYAHSYHLFYLVTSLLGSMQFCPGLQALAKICHKSQKINIYWHKSITKIIEGSRNWKNIWRKTEFCLQVEEKLFTKIQLYQEQQLFQEKPKVKDKVKEASGRRKSNTKKEKRNKRTIATSLSQLSKCTSYLRFCFSILYFKTGFH